MSHCFPGCMDVYIHRMYDGYWGRVETVTTVWRFNSQEKPNSCWITTGQFGCNYAGNKSFTHALNWRVYYEGSSTYPDFHGESHKDCSYYDGDQLKLLVVAFCFRLCLHSFKKVCGNWNSTGSHAEKLLNIQLDSQNVCAVLTLSYKALYFFILLIECSLIYQFTLILFMIFINYQQPEQTCL